MKFQYCTSLVEAKKYACTLLYAMYGSTVVKFSHKYLGSYIILVDLINQVSCLCLASFLDFCDKSLTTHLGNAQLAEALDILIYILSWGNKIFLAVSDEAVSRICAGCDCPNCNHWNGCA